jgi:hypothetical protein
MKGFEKPIKPLLFLVKFQYKTRLIVGCKSGNTTSIYA